MKVRYTICYIDSIKIIGAYCVSRVNNMVPWQNYYNGSILCRLGSQYATLAVSR